jgi:mannose-6-phosphate isomerase-like protein (cupin superfamily)
MRNIPAAKRSVFSPPNSKVQVAILAGKGPEHGDFNNHTIAVVKIPAGEKLDQHFHKHREESYYVLSGSGMAIVDGHEINLKPGDLVTVSPGERHMLKANTAASLEYLVVTAPAWTLEDVNT